MTDSVQTVVETELKKFDITEAAIEAMKAEFSPLKIEGIDDREGYKKVHEARMKVAGIRSDVEKRRVTLKEPFLEGGRKIDAEAKRITKQLLPIEEELKAKEKAIDEEKERIKEEQRKAEEARIKARFDKLQSVGAYLDLGVLKEMDEEVFEGYYEARKADHEKAVAERQRIQEEQRAAEEKRRAEVLKQMQEAEEEAERPRKEKAHLEQEKAALEKEKTRLAAEKAALEAEKTEAAPIVNEPALVPARPVSRPPEFYPVPETITANQLSAILKALSSAGYHNHQRALVEDENFIVFRKIAKGTLRFIL